MLHAHRTKLLLTLLAIIGLNCHIRAQNSMVGDGFGGRSWYAPTNYTVGSYSAYSICYDDSAQLYGWGANGTNQLGLGVNVPGVNVPTPIPNMTNVRYFSTGYNMGAIKNDGTGWVWGMFSNPTQVLTDAYFLDASSFNISFVKTDGTVWTLGDNSYGQYGDGTTTTSNQFNTPVQMVNVNNAVRVANNLFATIVLLEDSSLVSTGSTYTGLGTSVSQTSVPLPITGLPPIVDIKLNAEGAIALAANGDVYSWGIDYYTGTFNYSPVLLSGLNNVVAISGCDDGYHFMALTENGDCYGWGDFSSAFGFSSTLYVGSPTYITTGVIDIMAGETFSYMVKSDGSLWASGSTYSGSIWLNLPASTYSEEFIQLHPDSVLEACPIEGENVPTDTLVNASPVDDYSIMFPNVFSPNGDSDNDTFYFPNIGVAELNWQVYNRWGKLIYETNEDAKGWDGNTQEGEPCSEGTYYYLLYYKVGDEAWERRKGYLTLVR